MTRPAGDREWFEREVVSVLPDLYGTALRLARNPADAEDLAADAVARAWSHIESLRDRSSFRGWLFRILMNTYFSDCRARAARPDVESIEQHTEEDFSLFDRLHQPFLLWWGNPEQDFLDRLLREDLSRAVDGLPETFRTVVVMADLQGMSYREIAETLQAPIGTVRSRLARGRCLLQKALWKHALDAGLVHPDRTETKGHQ
jgi:RNA polymerase sigma-70 factor (ECF subfamily)